MSLSIQYETVDEATMRLSHTVVLYDGNPVYITKISGAAPGDPKPDVFRVYATPLPYGGAAVPKMRRDAFGDPILAKEVGDEQMRKFISSRKFDLSPFKMGFMNTPKMGPIYCTRAPMKQYKQGLSNETFSDADPQTKQRAVGFQAAIGMPCFVDMIKGKYPSLDDARRLIGEGKVPGLAFSRDYALIRDKDMEELILVYHKTTKIGFLFGDEVKLTKTMNCLRESLAELGLRG